MKTSTFLLLIICELLISMSLTSQNSPEWATIFSANYPETIYQNDMTTDSLGNVFVTGYINDTSMNNYKIITLKYSKYGQLLWHQEMDSVSYITKLAIDDSGNVYLGGSYYENLITIKYNYVGHLQWIKEFTGSLWTNFVLDIVTDDSCNVYVNGLSNGGKFTTIKYNSSGDLKWDYIGVGAGGSTKTYITIDNNGFIYTTGRGYDTAYTSYTIKFDRLGNVKWEQIYMGETQLGSSSPRSIKVDNKGNVYVLSEIANFDAESDYAVVKYDSTGNQIWRSSYSFSTYYDCAKDMVIDKYGNVYATGNIYPSGGGNDSIATLKFDKNGNFCWSKTYSLGYSNLDEASEIIIDSTGFIYVTGRSSAFDYKENFITLKYDSLGNQIWANRYQHTLNSSDEANSISIDKAGNIYVSGSSYTWNNSGILTIKYSYNTSVPDEKYDGTIWVNTYPNPFTNSFVLSSINDLQNVNLKIYDLVGKEVITINNINERTTTIDRGNLENGMYYYRLEKNYKIIASGKIIAQ